MGLEKNEWHTTVYSSIYIYVRAHLVNARPNVKWHTSKIIDIKTYLHYQIHLLMYVQTQKSISNDYIESNWYVWFLYPKINLIVLITDKSTCKHIQHHKPLGNHGQAVIRLTFICWLQILRYQYCSVICMYSAYQAVPCYPK